MFVGRGWSGVFLESRDGRFDCGIFGVRRFLTDVVDISDVSDFTVRLRFVACCRGSCLFCEGVSRRGVLALSRLIVSLVETPLPLRLLSLT